MKRFLGYVSASLLAMSLTACGGSESIASVAALSADAPVTTLSVAAAPAVTAESVPSATVRELPADEVLAAPTSLVATTSSPPTVEEILESLQVPSGTFVDSDQVQTVKVAPGQSGVVLTSFSRTEKVGEGYGIGNRGVTQLVFVNRSNTSIFAILDLSKAVTLHYGEEDMFQTAHYYVTPWFTDKGNGLIVTFFQPWYGQIPMSTITSTFRLTAKISSIASSGSLQLELVHVQAAEVTAKYAVDQSAPRTLVIDPTYVPPFPGKG